MRLLLVSRAVHYFRAADQDTGINPKRPPEQAENDQSTDADPAAADRDTHTAAAGEATFVTATVFDIVAAAKIIPTHYEILPKFFTCFLDKYPAIKQRFNFYSVSYCITTICVGKS